MRIVMEPFAAAVTSHQTLCRGNDIFINMCTDGQQLRTRPLTPKFCKNLHRGDADQPHRVTQQSGNRRPFNLTAKSADTANSGNPDPEIFVVQGQTQPVQSV